jgi:hypothetical protein
MITLAGVAVVMVNAASLTSLAVPPASVTRTFAAVDALFGTVHAYDPALAAVLDVTVVHVVPSSVYSSFTLVTPLDVQVMAWLLPPAQLSPPLGAVTVTEAVPPPEPWL